MNGAANSPFLEQWKNNHTSLCISKLKMHYKSRRPEKRSKRLEWQYPWRGCALKAALFLFCTKDALLSLHWTKVKQNTKTVMWVFLCMTCWCRRKSRRKADDAESLGRELWAGVRATDRKELTAGGGRATTQLLQRTASAQGTGWSWGPAGFHRNTQPH